MSDKKHIDRIFQEKFKDFDVSPDPKVWREIEARIQKKKKRRVIPIWWQLSGVAAALVLLFMASNFLFTDNTSAEEIPVIVNTESKNEQNKTNQESIDSATSEASLSDIKNDDGLDESNNKSNIQKQFPNSIKEKSHIAKDDSETKNNNLSFSKPNRISNKTSIAKNSSQEEKLNTKGSENNTAELKSNAEIKALINPDSKSEIVASVENKKDENSEKKESPDEKGQDIEEAIAEAKTIHEKEEEELRRWSVAPNVAPVLFNSFGKGSSIDNQFNNNDRTSDITLSVGVKGSYAINDRLKVTTGINRVNFNSTTSNIIGLSDNSFASATTNNNLENVALNSTIDDASLQVISRTSLKDASVPGAINTIQTGNLNQKFGFIEIPIELEYCVIDKKIGLNFSGGFSTLILNENEISADINGQNTRIGEANNINNTSFSANIGVGLDYGLTEKININLEPKFKYQLNTFNNTSGDFRPFFIGIYTGLSFKF